MDSFKESFKHFKTKNQHVDMSDVIDFNCAEQNEKIKPFVLTEPNNDPILGIKPVSCWKVYTLSRFPGFVFISNPFENGFQKYWIHQCVKHYPVKPNQTNLDTVMHLTPDDNIWDMGKNKFCEENGSSTKNILQKLRWATLGFHHNWNTKEYSKEHVSDFPLDLQHLSQYVAATLGCENYTAQAAIVNFYHLNSTLSGHNDHSEFDEEAPLISFSFGHTAVFLLGGQEPDEKPEAMYLRSGDIVIMMGPARLNYHAVPRIFPADVDYIKRCMTFESSSCESVEKDQAKTNINEQISKTIQQLSLEEWQRFEKFLLKGRINMNVRQVFPHGQNFDTMSYCESTRSTCNASNG